MKDYKNWTIVKARTNNALRRPTFREGEVYWVSLGENIGFEQDGKGKMFARPVLVLKKFSHELFLGLPLTSKEKQGKFYFSFPCKGKTSTAILSQIKVMDCARISGRRFGCISRRDFWLLKEKLFGLIK